MCGLSVKPLHVRELSSLLSRFENFTASEIKEITLKSPTVIEIRLSVQDSALEFDWIDLNFELSSVNDARILENSKLAYLDMNEGLSILFEENLFAFCYGSYSSLATAKDSSFYIIAQSLKFEELPFSG